MRWMLASSAMYNNDSALLPPPTTTVLRTDTPFHNTSISQHVKQGIYSLYNQGLYIILFQVQFIKNFTISYTHMNEVGQ